MSAKLEESQQQVLELSAFEEDRVQELHKLSQDRDRAWESELKAVQKQHAMDVAALASTMNDNELRYCRESVENLKLKPSTLHGKAKINSKQPKQLGKSFNQMESKLLKSTTLLLEFEQSKDQNSWRDNFDFHGRKGRG
ncbi:Interactor of constitutive active ROPs 2, chloroplastic, partial [Cucurbita argyrosperma subsp. sororia]